MDPQKLEWLDTHPRSLDWNGPRERPFVELRPEVLDRPIIENLRHVVRRHRDRVAMSDSDSFISFGELWEGVCRLGQIVAAHSERRELVAVLLPESPNSALAMLACLAAGRPFVLMDLSQPGDWIVETLRATRPSLILGSEETRALATLGATAAPFVDVTRLPRTTPGSWRPAALGPDEPACVLLTSGSTGTPKAIVNSQRALQQRAAQSINAAHINAEDRFLTLAPLASIVGVRDVITSALAGASIHFLKVTHSPTRKILAAIASQAITILFAAPALLRSIVPYASERASPALRLIRVGGETTLWSDIDLLRSWMGPNAAIQSIYAATEAPMMQWFVHDACRSESLRIPIGYPLAGNSLAVVDESGEAVARGEAGELIVRSPYVTLGCWSEVRSIADTSVSHTPSAQRVFRTGDLVRVRPDGLLERLGRKDRQVKIRGVRVELDGVEATVRRHPLVRDVGVLARTPRDGQAILVAYVSVREGASAAPLDELRESMSSVPQPMRPALWYQLDDIPRLPNFKLDLRALQALDANRVEEEKRRAESASCAPASRSNCIESTVARIWQDVLQAPPAAPEQDFFEMGGDSLKAIRLVSELESALGIELPITLINEAPSFGKLCAVLSRRRPTRYVPLVLLKQGAGALSVYFVHGLGGNVAELFPLARSMSYPGAVFGIQARGLRAQESPQLTVEAMAAEYVKAIKARQPRGPYRICGYSFGGLVAFEMGRQLKQSGDVVSFLGLFDATPSLGFAREQLTRFVKDLISAPVHRWPRESWRAGARMISLLRDHLQQRQPGGPPVPAFLKSAPAGVLKVGVSALLASARYRPGCYGGELTLFTPTSRDPTLPSPQVVWHRHARSLSVVPVAGAHLTMLSPANAGAAAASLSRALMLSASSPALSRDSTPSSSDVYWSSAAGISSASRARTGSRRSAWRRHAPTDEV
jgi:acyl-coenzyme A synthetase/AMP-(fatty) acid ligase/thioesterase domain-containing protein/acyl carrier protein